MRPRPTRPLHAASQDAARESLVLASRLEEIERAQTAVQAAMASRGWDETCRFAVRAALEEALSNAIEHGNAADPARSVRMEYEVGPAAVVLEISDGGLGFEPEAVPDPTAPENVDIPAGRGLTLMRAFMSEVVFHPPGNRVRLVYRRPEGPNGPAGAAGA